MPVQDWTRVGAGIFHHFHCAWIQTLGQALNSSVLPKGFYALTEQVAGESIPDGLVLESTAPDQPAGSVSRHATGLAVDQFPPRTALVVEGDEIDEYSRLQRALSIRHASDDRIVAWVEIVSRGNKQSRTSLARFVDKAVGTILSGIHLLVIDLIPPGRSDPRGIHGAIWDQLHAVPYEPPSAKPLTLVAYAARTVPVAYVEPLALGQILPDMPLFLTPQLYVNAPLETTGQQAYAMVPERWRLVLDSANS
ncbi:MAG: DUF4058 family protein [Planctomycetaceae bacterium]|nr:MAG: DUF4058 family protein [Planctomycetaceae bacterium]